MDAITFDGGPITHEERKELLQSINQYIPRRRSAKNADTDNADANGTQKKGNNFSGEVICIESMFRHSETENSAKKRQLPKKIQKRPATTAESDLDSIDSKDATTDSDSSSNSENSGTEVNRRKGRPPGSKNKGI